jgi:hypothetical protein
MVNVRAPKDLKLRALITPYNVSKVNIWQKVNFSRCSVLRHSPIGNVEMKFLVPIDCVEHFGPKT